MKAILRNLPYFDHTTDLDVQGQRVRVKPDQIIIWISLAEQGLQNPDATVIPAR